MRTEKARLGVYTYHCGEYLSNRQVGKRSHCYEVLEVRLLSAKA